MLQRVLENPIFHHGQPNLDFRNSFEILVNSEMTNMNLGLMMILGIFENIMFQIRAKTCV